MKYGLAVLLLGLAACSPQAQDQISRQAASATVTRVVTQRQPQLRIEPALTCILRYASPAQIDALASDSVTGPTESSFQIVASVISRPETVRCLSGA